MATNPSRDILAEIEGLNGQPRVTYPYGDKDYPVTERIETLQRGKAPKDFLSPEPDPTRFADLKLVQQSVVGSDHTHLRLYTKYEKLPTPWLIDERTDRTTGAVDTVARRTNLKSEITGPETDEGLHLITVGADQFIVIRDSQAIDTIQSTEIVETQSLPLARDADSQIVTAEESKPFQFPATLDVVKYGGTNGLVGYTKTFIRRVPHVTKTYWVFSDTNPTLTLNGVPVLATIDNLFVGVLTNEPLSELIVNGGTFTYSGTAMTIHASSPTLTEYTAAAPDGWLAGAARSVLGDVKQDGNAFRWRVDRVFVRFLRPVIPTYA